MAYGDENDFGWCNLFIKFALFVMNFLLWVSKERPEIDGKNICTYMGIQRPTLYAHDYGSSQPVDSSTRPWVHAVLSFRPIRIKFQWALNTSNIVQCFV